MKPGEGMGQDMAANVIVGLGLGYLAQKFFPEISPYGLAAGVLLGAASGFYQLFRSEAALRRKHIEEKKDRERKP